MGVASSTSKSLLEGRDKFRVKPTEASWKTALVRAMCIGSSKPMCMTKLLIILR